jgi:hypothetical protein
MGQGCCSTVSPSPTWQTPSPHTPALLRLCTPSTVSWLLLLEMGHDWSTTDVLMATSRSAVLGMAAPSLPLMVTSSVSLLLGDRAARSSRAPGSGGAWPEPGTRDGGPPAAGPARARRRWACGTPRGVAPSAPSVLWLLSWSCSASLTDWCREAAAPRTATDTHVWLMSSAVDSRRATTSLSRLLRGPGTR